MHNTAIILRALQLYAHNAHNLAKGKTFLQDHEFLGELYPAYEGEYDSIVERMIGLGEEPDLNDITKQAADAATANEFKDDENAFSVLLVTEKELCSSIKKDMTDASNGTQNLLQTIADNSEMRQYKLKRRLK
jgi:DNA-binding ferritin-like protein